MEEHEYIDFEVPANHVAFMGKDLENSPYVSISVGALSFVRPSALVTKTDYDTYTFRIPRYNARGEEYKLDLQGQLTVPGKEEKEITQFTMTTREVKELLDEELSIEKTEKNEKKEKPEFVAIKISKKRFCGEPWKTETMPEAMQSIYAADGWTYNRYISQLHESKEEPNNVIIYLPKKRSDGTDYMIRLTKDIKLEDETFEKKYFEISSIDLERMYQVEKKQYLNKKALESDFVELIISKKQVVGEPWIDSAGEKRVNIITPDGYTFSRKATQLHEVADDPYHFKINLPRTYTDGSLYTVMLAKSVRKENDSFEKITKEQTADDLKMSYEIAKQQFKQRGRTR